MYEKIAVATDRSIHCNRAIDTATDLAAKYDAELTVVHVLMHGLLPDTPRHMAETELLVEAHPNATFVTQQNTNYIDFTSTIGTRPCRACHH